MGTYSRLRVSAGLAYAKVHFRKKQNRVIRFTDSVTRSHRALIVLPRHPNISAVQWSLRYLKDRYLHGKLVVLTWNDFASALEKEHAHEIISFNEKDLNAFFIPRLELRQRVKTSTFDIAIDLSTDFDLTNAFLCYESDAPLRVSFAKEHGDRFYNFQLQTQSKDNVTVAYRNLIKCLEMF